MSKCENPLCQRPTRPGRKFCTNACKNVVAQRNYRERHQKQSGSPFRAVVKQPQSASVERIKERPLFVERKDLPGLGQMPPAPSKEFSLAMAERNEREKAERSTAEQKLKLLFVLDRTIKNLRALYLHGTIFRFAYNKRQASKNLGMVLCGAPLFVEADDYEDEKFSVFKVLDGEEKGEYDYAREYLEQQGELSGLTCEHGKSWRVECDACKLELPSEGGENWDQERANRALAKLGLSVWEGKSKTEITWGRGGGSGVLDAGEDVRNSTRDRKTRKQMNAADSYEKPGEDAPFAQGQTNSSRDPNYAEGLGASDDPNQQQVDAKQNLVMPDELFDKPFPRDPEVGPTESTQDEESL